ncbi:MAG: hypothetical protein IJM71_02450 [Clostridia bacterium]|nr:hypothetical protein [Clostridia bacterium]
MNENSFFNAMARIDGDLVDRVPREKTAPSSLAAPVAVAATASAAVLAAVLLSLAFSQKEPAARTVVEAATGSVSAPASEKAKDDEPTDPVPGAPVFTAEQIAELFKDTDMKSTNAYTTEYSPSSDGLNYGNSAVPATNSIAVYSISSPSVPATPEGAAAFGEKYLDGVCAALGIEKPEYEIEKSTISSLPTEYEAEIVTGGVFLIFYESPTNDVFSIGSLWDNVDINGLVAVPDPTKDDETIKRSLEPLRMTLCELFGVDLRDVSVGRSYDGNGLSSLTVQYYDAAANGVDFGVCRCSDNITVRFSGSAGTFSSSSIIFRHFRCTPAEICSSPSYEALIPLNEAERLLSLGYVFGGHCCPLCVAEQKFIDFEDYDSVRIEYENGVPFYAFFKYIGRSYGGAVGEYAKALVPAVKVSGLPEYFEAQEAAH